MILRDRASHRDGLVNPITGYGIDVAGGRGALGEEEARRDAAVARVDAGAAGQREGGGRGILCQVLAMGTRWRGRKVWRRAYRSDDGGIDLLGVEADEEQGGGGLGGGEGGGQESQGQREFIHYEGYR